MLQQNQTWAALSLLTLALVVPAYSGKKLAGPTSLAVPAEVQAAESSSCAVSLRDGSVLLTGGRSTLGESAGTRILRAAGGAVEAAPMSFGRVRHVCVALRDGRVLAAGGDGPAGSGNTAEIFDPFTRRWTPTGSMGTARAGAQAVALEDGKVLIAGGESHGRPTATLEVFDPEAGSFTAVSGLLSSPRVRHAAVATLDGRVLIFGGSDGKNALDTIDVYEPRLGTVAPLGQKLAIPRAGLAATRLLDGRVFLSGGSHRQDLLSTEIYDPEADKLIAGPPMPSARSGHSGVLVPGNNAVLLTSRAAGQEAVQSTIYIPWRFAYRSATKLPWLMVEPDAARGLVVSGGNWTAGAEIRLDLDPPARGDTAVQRSWKVATDSDGEFSTEIVQANSLPAMTAYLTATAVDSLETAQIQVAVGNFALTPGAPDPETGVDETLVTTDWSTATIAAPAEGPSAQAGVDGWGPMTTLVDPGAGAVAILPTHATLLPSGLVLGLGTATERSLFRFNPAQLTIWGNRNVTRLTPRPHVQRQAQSSDVAGITPAGGVQTTTNDGNLLFAGGTRVYTAGSGKATEGLNFAYSYDYLLNPTNVVDSEKPFAMDGGNRYHGSALRLPDGKLLVLGGTKLERSGPDTQNLTWEVFDRVANEQWKDPWNGLRSNMPAAAYNRDHTHLHNVPPLAEPGATDSVGRNVLAIGWTGEIYRFNPYSTAAWSRKTRRNCYNFGSGAPTGAVAISARSCAADAVYPAPSPDGTSLINPSSVPAGTTEDQKAVDSRLKRAYGMSSLALGDANGTILIAGGPARDNLGLTVQTYASRTNTWGPAFRMNKTRMYPSLVRLPDGDVLIINGEPRDGSTSTRSVNTPLYVRFNTNFTIQSVTEGTSPKRQSGGEEAEWRGEGNVALLLPSGQVLVAGGGTRSDARLYSPRYMNAGPRPVITGVVGSLPGYIPLVSAHQPLTLNYTSTTPVSRVMLASLSSVTRSIDWDSRYLVLCNSVAACGGATSGSYTINLPASTPKGYYMAFVVRNDTDGTRIPSAAQIVQVSDEVLVLSTTNETETVDPSILHATCIREALTFWENLGKKNRFSVHMTLARSVFDTKENIDQYKAMVFVYNGTDVSFSETRRAAIRAYMEGGGGFVGMHSAMALSDNASAWPWYRQTLVGGAFLDHYCGGSRCSIRMQSAAANRDNPDHPLMKDVSATWPWIHSDEWYNYGNRFTGDLVNPRVYNVNMLLTVDESTFEYSPLGSTYGKSNGTDANYIGTMLEGDHPIAWCRAIGEGRSYYNALGHEPNMYSLSPSASHLVYQKQLLRGVEFALGRAPCDNNRIRNAGFEYATSASDWLHSGPAVRHFLNSVNAYSGASYFSHRSTGGGFSVTSTQNMRNLVSGTYTLRARVRSGGGPATLEMGLRNCRNPATFPHDFQRLNLKPLVSSGVWREAAADFAVDHRATSCQVYLLTDSPSGAVADFDDVVLFPKTLSAPAP